MYIGSSNLLESTVTFVSDNWNTYVVRASTNQVEIILNDVSKLVAFNESIQKQYSVYLFANNSSNEAVQKTSLKIASFYIKDNGALVRNFIPAKRNSDNVLGMYDTVSGQFFTNQGSGAFAAGPVVVPTPDAPMDIVCNNGVLKVRHQSGLPLGYTALEYIQSSGSQYIDTGRVPNNNDIVEQKFQKVGTSTTVCAWYGSMPSSQTITPRFGVGSSVINQSFAVFAGVNYTASVGLADTNAHTLRFQASEERKFSYEFDGISGEFSVGSDLYTPAVELTSYLFARHGTDGVQVYDNEGTKIYYHREYLADGTLVLNMVPVKRDSDDVLGMYDTVSGQFFTNQGTGDFVAGDPVSDPVEVYTDGTVETINVHGKNLWDGKMYFGRLNQGRPYITNYTEITSPFVSTGAYSGVGLVVKVIPGQQYCFSSDVTNAEFKYVGFYANKEDATDYTKVISFANATTGTAPAGANYAVFCFANAVLGTEFSWTWAQAELGSTPTDYEPYYDGGTATCENLLSIGDYTDVQEVIAGDVTRKVGVKVLDGTENWTIAPATYADGTRRIYTNDFGFDELISGMSSHFVDAPLADRDLPTGQQGKMYHSATSFHLRATQFTSLPAAKQWLADQYNAGAPVIVIYPLATETTESVTGQPLNVTDGDNVIDITQASLSNLELEAEYTKGQ